MKIFSSALILASLALIAACNNPKQKSQEQNSDSTKSQSIQLPDAKAFQQTIDGKQTNLYVLKKGNMQVAVTNYGARVVSLLVPGRDDKLIDVVVGYDNIKAYTEGSDTYFGAIVGRYGNRIAKGKFKLDGKKFTLATNNGINHLHGGNKGFSRAVWDAQQPSDSTLVLTYLSKDGEEGYPGNLTAKVTYIVTGNND